MKTPPSEEKISPKYLLLNFIIIIFILYIAREVFIPIALAILLSFILISLVDLLYAYKFPKTFAIVITVCLAFFLFVSIGWLVYLQALRLSHNIPSYELNMHNKIQNINIIHNHIFSNLNDVVSVFNKDQLTSSLDNNKIKQPLPVQIIPFKKSVFTEIMQLSPLLSPFATALLTIIFLLYILFNRENLREKFILLISQDDLNLATQAIDDTAHRITRYLVQNLTANGIFGVFIGVGLYFIGIPNAFLWGLFTTLLRFIPYLGIWIAAFFPLALAFAIDPGWSLLIETLGLFIFAEMATNYFLEPQLYGLSTGLSSITVMIASVFWTWLWGIVGLILSVPLTVCIFMLGKYVNGLEFLEILLGKDSSLPPPNHLYQRLLAMDKTETLKIAQKYLKNTSLGDYYDQLLIPALIFAKKDRFSGTLAENRQKFILENAEVLIDIEEPKNERDREQTPIQDASVVIGIAARDEFDELVAKMLANCLKKEGVKFILIECVASSEDIKKIIRSYKKPLICISSLPPYALSPARHLLRKIQKINPPNKIIVGIWRTSKSITHLQNVWEDCVGVAVSLKETILLIKTSMGLEKEAEVKEALPAFNLKTHLEADLKNIPANELVLTIFKKIAKKFDVPSSLISILEIDSYFWKKHEGLIPLPNEAQENLAQSSVCNSILTSNETLLVPNVKKDARFATDSWLLDRGIQFFAGIPLLADEHMVGILCILDTKPRKLSPQNVLLLELLAKILMEKME